MGLDFSSNLTQFNMHVGTWYLFALWLKSESTLRNCWRKDTVQHSLMSHVSFENHEMK